MDSVQQEGKGKWSKDERAAFIAGLELFGKKWTKISAHVGTRTPTQTRAFGRKYLSELQESNKDCIPGDSESESPSCTRDESRSKTNTSAIRQERRLSRNNNTTRELRISSTHNNTPPNESTLQSEIIEIKSDIKKVKQDITEMKSEVKEIKADITDIKIMLRLIANAHT